MGLSCSTSVFKYLLFAFNLLCAVGGIALMIIGAFILYRIGHVKELFVNVHYPGNFVGIFMVIGAIVFIISSFGCCGTMRESECCMLVYSIFLIILVFAQVFLVAFTFLYIRDIQKIVHEGFETMWSDRTVEFNRKIIESVQRHFECCGNSSSSDYGDSFPRSCCVKEVTSCTSATIFTIGCSQRLHESVKTSAHKIAFTSSGLALVQLFAISFGCCLANRMRNSRVN